MAFHIPNPNLSTVDLTWWLEKTAKDNDIEMVKKQVSEDPLKDFWATLRTRLPPVTLRVTLTLSTFVAGAGIALNGNFTKFISLYDKEYGCSNRVVDYTASKG